MSTHHHTEPAHGSKGSIWTGSILSIILTVIPFWLVMSGALENATATTVIIFALAIAQIVVHVVCFLHVDSRAENGWTLLAFIFTAIIVCITIVGTIWVMYHMNVNMMPMTTGEMSSM
ncbi:MULTISPECIES: cytochrome o ubiquinol oxidase subunit IV [unclassified Rhizobium]|uniref:cytochrome o ubiquinol oxidase subunit IV n=1 Tax=unclassified Rhizobium TaxID=2613769 RepID=UPI001ADA5399|nr:MULTISPECIES: cytochrome o ubiquinol oxidase subunit IV [unclassified Rhizobium]MBO9125656.1 cytochrome o ubiquinol oxidase subunit IV [Rhizobium sp. 16-488-2b]MBO9176240.1 cytochrome o ubiquinol oxidase subunit IV [Rhizobium sp. 16-488-2a]